MRLLAPTRRTLNAKGGETKPVPNSELVEFRRLASEYAKEANSEVSRLNLAKKEHEDGLAKMEKERQERIAQADAQERDLSIKISSLQSKVEQLEASADAEKYRGLIKRYEASLK